MALFLKKKHSWKKFLSPFKFQACNMQQLYREHPFQVSTWLMIVDSLVDSWYLSLAVYLTWFME